MGKDIYADDRLHGYEPENPLDLRKFGAVQYLKYWKSYERNGEYDSQRPPMILFKGGAVYQEEEEH